MPEAEVAEVAFDDCQRNSKWLCRDFYFCQVLNSHLNHLKRHHIAVEENSQRGSFRTVDVCHGSPSIDGIPLKKNVYTVNDLVFFCFFDDGKIPFP